MATKQIKLQTLLNQIKQLVTTDLENVDYGECIKSADRTFVLKAHEEVEQAKKDLANFNRNITRSIQKHVKNESDEAVQATIENLLRKYGGDYTKVLEVLSTAEELAEDTPTQKEEVSHTEEHQSSPSTPQTHVQEQNSYNQPHH